MTQLTPDRLAGIEASLTQPVPYPHVALQSDRRYHVTNAELVAARQWMVEAANDRDQLIYEVQRLTRELAGRMPAEPCVCGTTYASYEGPEEDCPQHGRPYSYWTARAGELSDLLQQAERTLGQGVWEWQLLWTPKGGQHEVSNQGTEEAMRQAYAYRRGQGRPARLQRRLIHTSPWEEVAL